MRFPEAVSEGAVSVSPEVIVWIQQALQLHMAGRPADAEPLYLKALAVQPNLAPVLSALSLLRLGQGRPADALVYLDRLLAMNPADEEALSNRGIALTELGRAQEALASFEQVFPKRPGSFELRYQRARALKAAGRSREALAELDGVLSMKPDHCHAWVVRAGVLWGMGDAPRALDSYDRALRLDPDMPEALYSRANCRWTRQQDLPGALADLERLLRIAPDFPYARGALLHMRMYAGDWRDLQTQREAVDAGVRSGRRVVEPFAYQALASRPEDLLACATLYTADKHRRRDAGIGGSTRVSGRIRVGYVCGEFRAQATMYLAVGLFELHDRSRFEIIAFDNTREDGSAMRRRVLAAFDRVVPIQDLSDGDAAKRIAELHIDILVNLNGYFGGQRMDVFAYRPAPLQVNYLGFPGTLGCDYIDYIIADAEVISSGEERCYCEKVVRLAGCYQINDSQRPRPVPERRAAHGLKESDFVFCHFNYAYKIAPEMFALWMRLLKQLPAGVLWLLHSSDLFAANVREHAVRAQVDPSRIVFAPPMDYPAHLSRLALGDLFLDSLPYNAHTTASDALWAGLPLITCRGHTFPGRVAASVLRAAGLSELIMSSLEDYESTAQALAEDPRRLRAYREHLVRHRETLAPFDTALTTRRLESAYAQMVERQAMGLAPEPFDVA